MGGSVRKVYFMVICFVWGWQGSGMAWVWGGVRGPYQVRGRTYSLISAASGCERAWQYRWEVACPGSTGGWSCDTMPGHTLDGKQVHHCTTAYSGAQQCSVNVTCPACFQRILSEGMLKCSDEFSATSPSNPDPTT